MLYNYSKGVKPGMAYQPESIYAYLNLDAPVL
jgi:hypothetical protein